MVNFFVLIVAVLLGVYAGQYFSRRATDRSGILVTMAIFALGCLLTIVVICFLFGWGSAWFYLSYALVFTVSTGLAMAFKMLGKK